MPNKRPRLDTAAASNNGSRTESRGSTDSHLTQVAQPIVVHNARKYAPIRPVSQPPAQQQPDSNGSLEHNPQEQHKTSNDHDALRHIHEFNQGRPSPLDPALRALSPNRERPGSAPLHQRQFSEHYAASDGTPDPSMVDALPVTALGASAPNAAMNRDKKERKPPSNNATNEKELRDLIEKNYHRSLESIADEVRNAERSQKSEKAKQLFAMRW